MAPKTLLNAHSQLDKKLDILHGVGPRMLPKLQKLGLNTIEDALFHLWMRCKGDNGNHPF